MTSTAATVRKQIAAEQKQDKEDRILLKREQYSNMVAQWKNRKRVSAKPGRVDTTSACNLTLAAAGRLASGPAFATRFWTDRLTVDDDAAAVVEGGQVVGAGAHQVLLTVTV
jgi:hypothetical protein